MVGPPNLADRDIQDLSICVYRTPIMLAKDTPMEVAEVFGCRYVVIVKKDKGLVYS